MRDTTMTIAGVPEHFNLPWRLLIEHGLHVRFGLDLRWRDVPEGTGAMIDMLENGDCDVALLLSEGAVAGIAGGAGLRILGEYVASPLRWGVHVAADSDVAKPEDLPGRRFAISRYGSGSHLMAALYASQHDWPAAPSFHVVNHLDGAQAALAAGDADIFLWEQFTTQPLVDAGVFRRVDVLPTPWPCFVACIGAHATARAPIASALLQQALAYGRLLQQHPDAERWFAQRYGLERDAVRRWLAITAWSARGDVAADDIEAISRALRGVGLIDRQLQAADVLYANGGTQ